MKLILKHGETGNEYEIVGQDTAKGTVMLKGPDATVEEKFDPKRFKELGYTLIKRTSDE